MKGRIADFEVLNEGKSNESIQFDIEVDRPLIEMDAKTWTLRSFVTLQVEILSYVLL